MKPGAVLGLFTTASMIAVVNAVVGGTGVALLVHGAMDGALLWPAVLVGAVVFLGCMTVFLLYQNSRYLAARRGPNR